MVRAICQYWNILRWKHYPELLAKAYALVIPPELLSTYETDSK